MKRSHSEAQFSEQKLSYQLNDVSKLKEDYEIKFLLMAFENERLANFHNQMIDEVDRWKSQYEKLFQSKQREMAML